MIPRWLPNALTSLRIALLPVWLLMVVHERERALDGLSVHRALVISLLLLIGATDAADGALARRFQLATNLGAMLDAVADKLAAVVAVTFLVFFAGPAFTALPAWLWVALLARDLLLGIGWVTVFMKHRTVRVEHDWHGRLATLVLFAVVVAACAGAAAAVVSLGSLAVVALIVPGTWAYLREGFRQLGGRAA